MIALDDVLRLVDTAPPEKLLLKGFLGAVVPASNAQARELLLEHRYNLVINAAHALDEEVARLCQRMKPDRLALVRSNVYWTWPGTFAYPLHWDTHDLVAIQLGGRKRWELFEPTFEKPLRGQTLDDLGAPEPTEIARTVTLSPGDRLEVERGWGHRVMTVGDEPSVHITFGFHRPTRRDVLALAFEEALLAAEAEPRFRDTDLEELPDVRPLLEAALERQLDWYRHLQGEPFHLVRDPLRGIEVREGHPNQDHTPTTRVPHESESALKLRARQPLDVPRVTQEAPDAELVRPRPLLQELR